MLLRAIIRVHALFKFLVLMSACCGILFSCRSGGEEVQYGSDTLQVHIRSTAGLHGCIMRGSVVVWCSGSGGYARSVVGGGWWVVWWVQVIHVGLAFINGKSREVWEKGGMDGWMALQENLAHEHTVGL